MLPGGIGAAEAGMAGMFAKLAGLSWSLSVALTFVIRLVTLWFATLVGVVGLLVVRRVIGEPLAEPALREALQNATPESCTEYEERFGGMFGWEKGSYDEG